jgi:hypothetical protein
MKLLQVALLLCLSLPTLGSAQEKELPGSSRRPGNGGLGGGDALSEEIRAQLDQIGENGEIIKPKLKAFFTSLLKFRPTGPAADQIREMVARGLFEDIELTRYEPKRACYNEAGEERFASTVKGWRDRPSQHWPICLNLRFLAIKEVKVASLAGLLAHEHARHFGFEDTDDFGIQAISEFVSKRYSRMTGDGYGDRSWEARQLRDRGERVMRSIPLVNNTAVTSTRGYDLEMDLFVNFPEEGKGLNLYVEEATESCRKGSITSPYFRRGGQFEDELGGIVKGVAISLERRGDVLAQIDLKAPEKCTATFGIEDTRTGERKLLPAPITFFGLSRARLAVWPLQLDGR